MNPAPSSSPHFAIACGGTGGHLFPGMAVGERLFERGASVTLIVSAKEVDQRALSGDHPFSVVTLPALGFSWGRAASFLAANWRSYRSVTAEFRAHPPLALLAMGGFTSAPPALAARRRGCPVYLHEGNAIPGRANRWLARIARRVYVYFPEAGSRLPTREVRVVGMPVRRDFGGADAAACRMALGLDSKRPVLLVTGGSQGASGINDALIAALPGLAREMPNLQFLHLTGPRDEARVRAAYETSGRRAVVRAFLTEMDLALGAADAVVTRAGASSAAEIAAVRIPALLIPYPFATDRHQDANALALQRSGAALVLDQDRAVPGELVPAILRLLRDQPFRDGLRAGLADWHRPDADTILAEDLLGLAGIPGAGGTPARGAMAERALPA